MVSIRARRALLRGAALCCAPALVACAQKSPPLVCDSTMENQVVFGFHTLTQAYAGSSVFHENGVEHLFVDGACNYWAYPWLATEWIPVRRGRFTDDELAAFNAEVLQRGWSGFGSDQPIGSYYESRGLIVGWYRGNVGARKRPSEFEAVTAATRRWIVRLAEKTPPIPPDDVAPLRVVVWQEDVSNMPTTPWTGDPQVLRSLARTPTESMHFGRQALLDGAPAAEILRAWRARGSAITNLLSLSEGKTYQIYARYALPFEDDDGLVRAPGWGPLPERDR